MNSQSKMILSFLAGAAAGVAVAYLVSSDRGEEIVDEIKGMANRLKDTLASRMGSMQADADAAAGVADEDFMGV